MDAMEEIQDKLERISRLLREIERILCERKEHDGGRPAKTAVTCVCTCAPDSDPGKYAAAQSDGIEENAAGKITENVCPENRAKREEPDRERVSARARGPSCSNAGKDHVEKIRERDASCNNRSRQLKSDYAPRRCAREEFARRIRDINEKCMSYFEDANRSN